MITALLLDDEPPARHRLRELLAEHPDVTVADEADDLASAMRAMTEHCPDVVFLDISLPGDNGFELLDLLGLEKRPAVVVVTAHAGHAVKAFEIGAVDYLLKPFARARLAVALSRVRDHLASQGTAGTARPAAVSRIPLTSGGKVRFVDVERIESIRADRNYVRIHAGSRPILVRTTLRQIEQRLPPRTFLRVNRSVIVRADRITEIEVLPHGELALRLAGGEQVISGRAHSGALRTALGLAGSDRS